MFRPYNQKCLEELISTSKSDLKVLDELSYVVLSQNQSKIINLYWNNPSNFVRRENLHEDYPNGHRGKPLSMK